MAKVDMLGRGESFCNAAEARKMPGELRRPIGRPDWHPTHKICRCNFALGNIFADVLQDFSFRRSPHRKTKLLKPARILQAAQILRRWRFSKPSEKLGRALNNSRNLQRSKLTLGLTHASIRAGCCRSFCELNRQFAKVRRPIDRPFLGKDVVRLTDNCPKDPAILKILVVYSHFNSLRRWQKLRR